jgi:hypothetical protein
MSDSRCEITCGNDTCFPIFTGRRLNNSASPPNTPFDVCHILQCLGNVSPGQASFRLWRRQRQGASNNTNNSRQCDSSGANFQWVLVPITCPFVFYDISCELICLIGIPVATPPTTTSTSTQNTTGAAGMTTATTTPVVTSNIPATVSAGAGQVVSAAPTNAVTTGPVVQVNPTGSNFVVAQVVNSTVNTGPNGLIVPGPHNTTRNAGGQIVHARVVGNSTVSASDAGAIVGGHFIDRSVGVADNDASNVLVLAYQNSKALALGQGSTVRGQVGCNSVVQAGGSSSLRNIPARSGLTLTTVGKGIYFTHTSVSAIRRGVNGCNTQAVFLENANNNIPLPVLGCQVCTDSEADDHLSGNGHGSLVNALATNNSLVHTAGDGALAVGVAKNCEVHVAAGLASQVRGRGNIALAAYSDATGHGAIAHMHGQFAQAIKGTRNSSSPGSCNQCQYNRVLTHSSARCEPILSNDGLTITGFTVTYTLVLGDTPEIDVITTPEGTTVTNYRLPALICPGVAAVDVEIVSPSVAPEGTPLTGLGAFRVTYCLLVTRTDMDGCVSHRVLPAPGTTLTPLCSITEPGTTIPTVTTRSNLPNNICNGFTIQFTETIPVTPGVNPRVVSPNPITPQDLLVASRRTFNIIVRTICATFKYTESPSGFAQIACAPPLLPPIRSVQIPPFIAPTPVAPCSDPNGGGGGGGNVPIVNPVNPGGGGGGNVPIVNPVNPGGGGGGNVPIVNPVNPGGGGGGTPSGVVGFAPGLTTVTTGVNVPNTIGCQTCPASQGGQVTSAAAAIDNTLLGLDLTGFQQW